MQQNTNRTPYLTFVLHLPHPSSNVGVICHGTSLQKFGYLSRDQRLTRARWAKEEHAAHVVDAELSNDVRRVHTTGEGPAEDTCKLVA